MVCEKSVVCGRGEGDEWSERSVVCGRGEGDEWSVRRVWCVGGVRVMSGRGGWGQLNFTNQNGHTN